MSSVREGSRLLHILDEAPLTAHHWKIVGVTGLGFFTDAYDLFIISTVTAILQPLWHLSNYQTALLNSAALLSAACGALVFGHLLDRVGRRTMYGYETLILAVGAILSAVAPNYAWLFVSRLILGFGVGGDYPASAVIVSEFANRPDRGRLVTAVFAMQGIGLVAGPLIAMAVLDAGVGLPAAWRIFLALGAVPAALGFILRRRMSESPRYLSDGQASVMPASPSRGSATPSAEMASASEQAPRGARARYDWRQRLAQLLKRPFLTRLIGTSLSWFLVDVIFYGNGVSYHVILHWVFAKASLRDTLLISLLLFSVFALPGYILAAFAMDRLGRRWIQGAGFIVIALTGAAVFAFPGVIARPWLFTALYGVSYLFIEFGPNTTTFLLPAELFPTHLRGSAHGIASALGKMGAFLAALCFPAVLSDLHMAGLFGVIGLLAAFGAITTWTMLPESRRRALEEMNAVMQSDDVHHNYARIVDSMTDDCFEQTVTDELLQMSGASAVTLHRRPPADAPTALETAALAVNDETLRPLFTTLHHIDTAGASAADQAMHAAWRQALNSALDEHRPVASSTASSSPFRTSIQSFAVFPLVHREECMGVLTFWDDGADTFSARRLTQLDTLIKLMAKLMARRWEISLLNRLALTDPLTRLANRLGLELEVERRIMRDATHAESASFAFVIFDLDKFKQLNDSRGHQSGDQALGEIGRAFREAHDTGTFYAARLGGDEFVLLYDHAASHLQAVAAAERLIDRLPLENWNLGVSAGLSLCPEDGATYQELYRAADARLYHAKRLGGRRMVFQDERPEQTVQLARAMRLP